MCSRIGEIEVELTMGSNNKSVLLAITDRATMVTIIEKLYGKNT
jgi:IS30 family transposase